jgi:hypothetical protein
MTGAEWTLARWHARKAVKQELLGQGLKLSHVEASEISRKANQYIEDHPEVLALACESYRRLVADGRLRPPRQRKSVQHL